MKNKKIILFLISQAITLFGSSIVQFTIIWYVTMKTSSGVLLALLTISAYLPQFLISFISGVWADRHSKKMLIILSDSIIALATLALAIFIPNLDMEKDSMILIIALIIILIIRSLGTGVQTPAVNALIPTLVDENELMRFNGINTVIQSVVQFVSPIVAGVVLSFWNLEYALYIDIITAIIGIAILLFIKISFTKVENSQNAIGEIKEGIKYAVVNKEIGKVLITFGIFIFLCVPAGFMSTLFIERYFGNTYWYLSAVEVAGFIGMVLGGLILSIIKFMKNSSRSLTIGIISFSILSILMGLFINFIFYLGLMFIYGIALSIIQTSVTTILQEKTEASMQGRIFGLFSAIYSLFLPIGMLAFGPLSDIVSLRILIIVTGILLGGVSIYIYKAIYKSSLKNVSQNVD